MQLTLVLINDFYLDQLFEAVFEITQKDVAIFTGKQPQNVAVVLSKDCDVSFSEYKPCKWLFSLALLTICPNNSSQTYFRSSSFVWK